MRMPDERQRCRFAGVSFPLGVTLLTESSELKVRHPAAVVSLCETGGEFTSGQCVIPGQVIGFILHPDLRYAVRGQVVWARPAQGETGFEFGVAFEENVPDSLWACLEEVKAA